MWYLIDRLKQNKLSPTEESELDRLQDEADEEMLLRSTALALLKKRGYDVNFYFKPTTEF